MEQSSLLNKQSVFPVSSRAALGLIVRLLCQKLIGFSGCLFCLSVPTSFFYVQMFSRGYKSKVLKSDWLLQCRWIFINITILLFNDIKNLSIYECGFIIINTLEVIFHKLCSGTCNAMLRTYICVNLRNGALYWNIHIKPRTDKIHSVIQ